MSRCVCCLVPTDGKAKARTTWTTGIPLSLQENLNHACLVFLDAHTKHNDVGKKHGKALRCVLFMPKRSGVAWHGGALSLRGRKSNIENQREIFDQMKKILIDDE